MPLHSVLGYVVVGLAALGFVLALVALMSRSKTLSRLMFFCFIFCGLIQIPTLASGVIDNAASSTTVYEAAALTTAADVAPFNFFVGASFFTLTLILVAWRGVNPGIVWDSRKWLIYLAAALGHVLLGVALIWLGRLALSGG